MIRKDPKAEVSEETESWYQRNKATLGCKLRVKSWRLKTRYGITLLEYESLLKKQDNKCKICLLEKPLHVDHCHTTGKIRGLLCYKCNNGLGCFEDKEDYLERALSYLRNG